MESSLILTSKLLPILEQHHVRVSLRQGSIQVDGTDVQMQALGYTSEGSIQLDVNVRSQRLLQARTLTESSVGSQDDLDEAIGEAFYAFCIQSLHTILAVFVDRRWDEGQTSWETWGKSNRAWNACLGPITPRSSAGDRVTIADYRLFLDALRDAYLLEASHELHWLRIYRGSLHGECIGRELLLDNEE